MSALQIVIDSQKWQARVARAATSIPKTLDRFVQRAAGEFSHVEKKEAPKVLTALTNSIQVVKNAPADYSVGPRMKYAAAVNNGGRPHWAPLAPLMDWLRVTKRVTDQHELRNRAKGLQRFIAAHGTKANPFVQRTRSKMDSRVIALLREGAHTSLREAFEA